MAMEGNSEDFDTFRVALEFVENLAPEFVACRRRRRHDFENGTQIHGNINRDGSIHQEVKCADCGTVIVEDLTLWGFYVTKPHYIWPPGYRQESDDGVTNPESIAAALRLTKAYERMGKPLPDTIRRRPRRKRGA